MKRGLISIILLVLGTSAYPFSDGFEAKAQTTCMTGARLDIGDGKGQILLSGGGVCQVLGENLVKAQCQLDPSGNCKRTNTPPEPPIDNDCALDLTPAGWKQMTDSSNRPFTYEKIFYGASFPNSPSHLAPIGSFSGASRPYTKGKPITGQIISVPVKLTDATKNVNLSWKGSQSIPAAGYSAMSATTVLVSVSKCKGDTRVQNYGPYCSVISNSESRIVFGTNPSLAKCSFPSNTTVWINIAFPDQTDPTNPTKNGCAKDNPSGGTHCDRNFTVR